MKLCKFLFEDKEYCGVVDGEVVNAVEKASIFDKPKLLEKQFLLKNIQILCPTNPTNIFAVGLNYKHHAQEMNMELPMTPLMFLKAVSSLTEHGSNIILPSQTEELSCEAELAIVIKDRCKNVSVADAKKHILGYSMINDVTARDIQRQESQWVRAKSFDTFCPYGPFIETDIDDVGPGIRLYIDDRITQNSRIDDMIFSPEEILSFVSKQCTLNQGDIIATGTPSGVTTVYPGEKVVVEIDNLGMLSNQVVAGDE